MSTFLYNRARSDFATGALNWPTLTIKAMLVTAGYVPSTSHQFVSDISGPFASSIVTRDIAGSAVTQVNGVCAATLAQVNALLWPDPVVAVILYVSTGVDSTSRLIYYSSDGFGFPFQAQGFDYAVAYDQAYSGWFQV